MQSGTKNWTCMVWVLWDLSPHIKQCYRRVSNKGPVREFYGFGDEEKTQIDSWHVTPRAERWHSKARTTQIRVGHHQIRGNHYLNPLRWLCMCLTKDIGKPNECFYCKSVLMLVCACAMLSVIWSRMILRGQCS